MPWRERVAHVFTAEDWKARRSVMVLVGVAGVWMVAAIVTTLLNGELDAAAKIFQIVVAELTLYLLFLRPARRSLRPWDSSHPRLIQQGRDLIE